ncbi:MULTISPECIES: hypothetical protein [Streptomyces]|uniref:Pyruvate carboxyltransferase domain-containing protein n=1 Tax=Streptomyces ramulosus TaxID=47762 RepID=A0ABW1FBM2_9ACTN
MTERRSRAMSEMELLDCTLRDGAYAVDFEFDENFVAELLAGLNETPVSRVEIGHGIGLEAERTGIKAGNIDHFAWCDLARSTLPAKPWGMFAQPEFTRPATIKQMCDRGMSFIRVGVEPDRVQEHLPYLRQVADVCGEVHLNLMKSSATPVDRLLGMLDGIGPEIAGVYVVDSYGAMTPETVERYVRAVADRYPVVGFHGHDNLGLATINTVTAFRAGATLLDGTLNGIGRGSGNAATESLAALANVMGKDRFAYRELAELAELCRVNMQVIGQGRTMQVLGAVIGIHSGFFRLVEELAVKYRTDPVRLMETAVRVAEESPRAADFHAAAARIADGERPHHFQLVN